MQLPKPKEGGSYTPAPAGTHTAICIAFMDIGTQSGEYQGERTTRHQVVLIWELVGEHMPDGKPFTISKWYTWSTSEKSTLRHHLEAWRGKAFVDADFEGPEAFDTRNLLGKPCTLTIQSENRDGKVRSKIASVGAKLKGVQVGEPVNPLIYISLAPDDFDLAAIRALPDYWRETIEKSPEYQSALRQNVGSDPTAPYGAPDDVMEDEVPF